MNNDKKRYYMDLTTGELFNTYAGALANAIELYDYGDDTNGLTWRDIYKTIWL